MGKSMWDVASELAKQRVAVIGGLMLIALAGGGILAGIATGRMEVDWTGRFPSIRPASHQDVRPRSYSPAGVSAFRDVTVEIAKNKESSHLVTRFTYTPEPDKQAPANYLEIYANHEGDRNSVSYGEVDATWQVGDTVAVPIDIPSTYLPQGSGWDLRVCVGRKGEYCYPTPNLLAND